MKYRTLGKTGLKVSVVGVGAWQFGGEWGHDYTQAEVNDILAAASDCGINLIDTAECYGDHLSETLIGGFLKERNREDWVIATKFGHRFHDFLKRDDAYDAKSVSTQLDASLLALGVETIDLYQFHSGPPEAFLSDELWTMLDKARRDGKIRHLGVSLNKRNPMEEVEAAPTYDVETVQVIYNRLDQRPEEDVFPACRENNLGVLARVPLASGFLSGKYKPGDTFPDNDVRSRKDAEETAKALEEVRRIQDNEVPEGVPMARWALGWCLQHEAVSCVIPGCKNPEQVEKNAAAADMSDFVRDDHPQAV